MVTPALQRLLSRPSSIEFLRFLVGTPVESASATRCQRMRRPRGRRRYGAAAGACEEALNGNQTIGGNTMQQLQHQNSRSSTGSKSHGSAASQVKIVEEQLDDLEVGIAARRPPEVKLRKKFVSEDAINLSTTKLGVKLPWREDHFTFEELDHESNVADSSTLRMVDWSLYQNDMRLWSCLLQYRERIYGDDGVLMFWRSMRDRGVLPTSSRLEFGNCFCFWKTFLELGFKNHAILEEIITYADNIWKSQKRKWKNLYITIIQHFLLNNDGTNALRWHQRLVPIHAPPRYEFGDMCRTVALAGGEMNALKAICKDIAHPRIYGSIVPKLCSQERFNEALDWHFFFLENGDRPETSANVESLIQYLSIYNRSVAREVTRSLVDAGVPFVATLNVELADNTKISREMMNLIHGQKFGIQEKKYNDSLGARWFATTFVSLNVAISTVHALGTEEIGPLSLQAICLRELNPDAVSARISQLEEQNISIGSSLFSRAVKYFAVHRKAEFLEGLVRSDQHPDELENGPLQEQLLVAYAQAGDFAQYERTLAVRSLVGKIADGLSAPKESSVRTASHNLNIRSLVSQGKIGKATRYMLDMKDVSIPVTPTTISHVVRHVLSPRRPGHRPLGSGGYGDRSQDLTQAIQLLQNLMQWSYVPPLAWREVLRRLGMLCRFQELKKLCLWLADAYSASSPFNRKQYRTPIEVPSSHPLHPLSILFNNEQQQSIVEFGFIAELKRNTNSLTAKPRDVACGVRLLRKLNEKGVHINSRRVRKAVMNRLVTYYGPGVSNKVYNRSAARKIGHISEVARQIDDALGGVYLTAPDAHIGQVIQGIAHQRWQKLRSLEKSKGIRRVTLKVFAAKRLPLPPQGNLQIQKKWDEKKRAEVQKRWDEKSRLDSTEPTPAIVDSSGDVGQEMADALRYRRDAQAAFQLSPELLETVGSMTAKQRHNKLTKSQESGHDADDVEQPMTKVPQR